MTHTIIFGETQLEAFDWREAAMASDPGHALPHVRNLEVLQHGVSDLRPGEASFQCDENIPFDTTFELKADGRKFVVISREGNLHVAKP